MRLVIIYKNYFIFRWLIYQPKDPYDQLKWLADTLLEAENNDEFVHILGHIPAGASQCQHTWSREYRKIINRFAHIITAQFNGHTHNDEFNVFYASNSTMNLINVAWNGGSLTPYSYLNPNYKIYMANTKTFVSFFHQTCTLRGQSVLLLNFFSEYYFCLFRRLKMLRHGSTI